MVRALARVQLALVVSAEIDDRLEPQRVERAEILVGRRLMVRRAPQRPAAQPPAAFDGIAAIIAEIVDAGQWPDSLGNHHHSPVNTGGRFSTNALKIGRAACRERVCPYV